MKITEEQIEDVTVFRFSGEPHNQPCELLLLVRQHVGHESRLVVIDLSPAQMLSANCLGSVIASMTTVLRADGTCAIVQPAPSSRAADLWNSAMQPIRPEWRDRFTTVDTLDDALEFLAD